ncbi:hypothetical protein BDZ91DRAFT_709936 [Kalaharituber pfeilii]|nr:hypothetical protein BDZ91DRAFT_709936 [Kalaharituber pfeilii]
MPSAIALKQPTQNVRAPSKVDLPKDAVGLLKNRPPVSTHFLAMLMSAEELYCKITAYILLFLFQLPIIGLESGYCEG